MVTLRDRTELVALLRELDGERGLTDSLRAQQHEFANRMHAIAGLLDSADPQEALNYLTEIQGIAAELDNTLRTHIAAPQIVGLLLGKAAEASERGIRLEISPETWLSESPGKVQVLISVLGNLVDNAMEALVGRAPTASRRRRDRRGRRRDHRRGDRQRPGVPSELVPRIFPDGFTTKDPRHGRPGGLGPGTRAPAGDPPGRHRCRRAGGRRDRGAVFTVDLPKDERERPTAPVRTR